MADARVVAVVGNPNPRSRTCDVAALVAGRVGELIAVDEPLVIDLVDHAPKLLQRGHDDVAALRRSVLAAHAVVVASPTYKAAYTGLLKLFLDQFDAGELGGTPTVPVMTGGSLSHSLAVDVHLVPVLTEIGASCPARGLYVWGEQLDAPGDAIDAWFARARPLFERALAR
ncbi:MAG TPA: NAD(P)H-dependent oxidoreductase [Acidimicrobiia bacterium]|nr:NAD(P)H-dependent oxidoreductase [Acidimicrobiia bacterium]